jgi:hypothetical protein
MIAEELLARLFLVVLLAAQFQALVLAWKGHKRFAASAIGFSPILFLYFVSLVNRASSETARIGLTSWFTIVFFLVLFVPFAIALLFLGGVRLRPGLLWLGWALNWIPGAFLLWATFFFKLRF